MTYTAESAKVFIGSDPKAVATTTAQFNSNNKGVPHYNL